MDEDFYTITQALGKYHDNDFLLSALLALHPVLYVSTSTYKGSMDRYKRGECTFPTSKK
jgi:hypothetical protein